MLGTAALFRFAPRLVAAVFLNPDDPANADAIGYAVTFLSIAALFQVVDGIQVAASGALRGLRDTRVPMVISLVAYWLIGMTVSTLLAFPLGYEGRGLWAGLVAGLGVAAVLLLRRFLRLSSPASPSMRRMATIGRGVHS